MANGPKSKFYYINTPCKLESSLKQDIVSGPDGGKD